MLFLTPIYKPPKLIVFSKWVFCIFFDIYLGIVAIGNVTDDLTSTVGCWLMQLMVMQWGSTWNDKWGTLVQAVEKRRNGGGVTPYLEIALIGIYFCLFAVSVPTA